MHGGSANDSSSNPGSFDGIAAYQHLCVFGQQPVPGATKPTTSTAGRSVFAYRVDWPGLSDEVPINKGSLPQDGARAGTLPTLS
jgi:hypothetical protein